MTDIRTQPEREAAARLDPADITAALKPGSDHDLIATTIIDYPRPGSGPGRIEPGASVIGLLDRAAIQQLAARGFIRRVPR